MGPSFIKKFKQLNNRQINEYSWLATVMLLALIVRLFFITQNEFPLNDGGMFYSIIEDILNNNFNFFQTISYNAENIPFVYPPLMFYVSALIHNVFGMEIVTVLRILPVIFSTLTVFAGYKLCKEVGFSTRITMIAITVFALLPSNVIWFIMGGGLTRSAGIFFGLFAATVTIRALKEKSILTRNFVVSVLLIALTVLIHLEGILFYAIIVTSWIIVYSRNRTTVKKIIGLVLLAVITLSPWIVTIVYWHSFAPYFAALSTNTVVVNGSQYSMYLGNILSMYFTEDIPFRLLNSLTLLGIFVAIKRRLFFPVLLLLVVSVFMSRSALNYSSLPVALLIAVFVDTFYQFLMDQTDKVTIRILKTLGISILIIYSTLLVFDVRVQGYLDALTQEEIHAMEWISQSTPKDAEFIVIDKELFVNWALDEEAEWFPTLAKRHAITTVQGKEWIRNEFLSSIEFARNLYECEYNAQCYEQISEAFGRSYDHIYINTQEGTLNDGHLIDKRLLINLANHDAYRNVYVSEEGNVSVWCKTEITERCSY